MEISKANIQMDAAFTSVSQKDGLASSKVQSQSINAKSETNNEQNAQNENLNEKLADITEKLNEQMDSLDTNIRFGYSEKMGAMYISVTEKSTGREIRQIPTEEALKLAEYFKDVIGMIFDKES